MNVVCPNCHSVFSVRGEPASPDGGVEKCPVCDYPVEQGGAGPAEPGSPERDYGQTMVLFTPVAAGHEGGEASAGMSGEHEKALAGRKIALEVVEGDGPGREYQLTKPSTVIGRSHADIRLDDPEVSRRHASVELMGDKVVINDLGSTNGTFVNSLSVSTFYLGDGDVVMVGNTRFKVVIR